MGAALDGTGPVTAGAGAVTEGVSAEASSNVPVVLSPRLNPAGALMSGSGSTVFALGRDAADAWRITRALGAAWEAASSVRVHCVRSCD